MNDHPQGISANRLRSFMERLEQLESEKEAIMEVMRDVFAEAKSDGFDVKIIRQLLKQRKMKQEELAEQEELLDLYRHALGMIPEST